MTVLVGDCLLVMPTLAEALFDSIVTDPPYGLGFMGKAWDHAVPGEPFWREALRVAKPGAFLVAFGGTRTSHRMACAIEDAGWELRDTLMWVYGSGFPKSHNGEWGGTALKPAWEPIILARKPLIGTVEANWREHGTGALNIDACRVEAVAGDDPLQWESPRGGIWKSAPEAQAQAQTLGRWPANVAHDGSAEVLSCFPKAPGQQGDLTGDEPSSPFNNTYGDMARTSVAKASIESGSAARFFYAAKASRGDRNDGLDGLDGLVTDDGRKVPADNAYQRGKTLRQNHHPTVKPTDLMRWLVRLVTPPGGLVLDPFMGSGSTGRAAVAEGMGFTGIELDTAYAAIAEARIKAMQPGLAL